MKLKFALLASMLIALSLPLTAQGPKPDVWTIAGVDKRTKRDVTGGNYEEVSVRFTNGRSYRLPLYRAEPIAVLAGEDGTPVLMVAGTDCIECDENKTLRFYVLGGRELKRSNKGYSYPGSLKAYDTGKLVSRTRTLYGKCLNDRSDVVVWFEQYKGR